MVRRHGRKEYSMAMDEEQRNMPVKRASGKHESPRLFGHPGKRSKTTCRAGLDALVYDRDQTRYIRLTPSAGAF